MTKSYPSNKSVIIDAPGEIQIPDASFVYNFYLPDEYNNEYPLNATPNRLQNDIQNYQNTSLRQQLKRKIERFVPRYVNLKWNPITLGNRPDWIGTVSIKNNLDKILDEETLSSDFFTSILFKDNGADGKVLYAINKAIDSMIVQQSIDTSNISQLDIVKILNGNTSNQVESSFLAESFIDLEKNGIKYVNSENKKAISETIIDQMRNVKLKASFNNKRIATLIRSSTQQPDNIYGDETYATLPLARTLQENAIVARSNSVIDAVDYQMNMPNYINYNSEVQPGVYKTDFQIIGYIVEKKEYPTTGQPIVKNPIIVDSPNVSECIDFNVKYGTQYGYTVKSVFLLEIPTYNITEDSIEFGMTTYLVASQRSPEAYIVCKENVPPPPPVDFDITWDYQRNVPFLTWNLPVNTQRDIKYVQVFKRNGFNEPFQLYKVYDFNDSQTPLSPLEMSENFIDQVLVENLRNPNGTALPVKYYRDEEFTKENTAIYAVACIDAHGYSSNYSVQLQISFDRNQNKLIKKSISKQGAPKAYPNFFLQKDAFVDSIRTSGSKKLQLIFNPEYLKVTSQGSPPTDLQLLKTDPNSIYKLQMINIDLQNEQTVDITLQDTRNQSNKPGTNNISKNSTTSINNNIGSLTTDKLSLIK